MMMREYLSNFTKLLHKMILYILYKMNKRLFKQCYLPCKMNKKII